MFFVVQMKEQIRKLKNSAQKQCNIGYLVKSGVTTIPGKSNYPNQPQLEKLMWIRNQ